jgi:hypothetical protein
MLLPRAILAGLVLAAGCAPGGEKPERPRETSRGVVAPSGIVVLPRDAAPLRAQFNADSDKVRLLLLLSPT